MADSGPDVERAHHVLIVDDNDDARETLAHLLHAYGCRVDTAPSAEEALRRFPERPHPCVVILDLVMPGIDGWTFYDRMRADAALTTIPVIIVSGHIDEMTRAANREACHFILKPAQPAALIAAVNHYCGRRGEHVSTADA